MTSLFEPHSSLNDPEIRRQSRLLGISLCVLTVLFMCVDVTLVATTPGYTPPWFGYGLLISAFALNHSGRYRLAAAISMAMFPLVVFGLVYSGATQPPPTLSFSYLALGPMLGAIFLPIWGVALLTVSNLCGIALAPLFSPDLVHLPDLIGPLSANAMVGVLATFYMHHRNGVEADRRRVQQQNEAQLLQAQKMEALGRLSGGMAHDFNNVLMIILGSVGLLRRRSSSPELDQIEAAAQSAATLTRQLLAFSRSAVLEPTVLQLGEVVTDATAMIGRLIGEDVLIRYEPAIGLWPTRLDRNQLEQVLLNLATNARDAMPRGGTLGIMLCNVEVREHDPRLTPDVKPGHYVLLRVTDSGAGMDEQTRLRIFEPFFTTKDRGKGTGLGLAMVFGMVSQSGGFIDVRSTPGRGTRFDLYFPRAQGAVAAKPTLAQQEAPGDETLLLVEDDDSVRKVVGLILQEAGYRVLAARSSAHAKQLWAEHGREIALLITDEVMPGGHGTELVAELRRAHPDLRALCMTGYAEPGHAAMAQLDLPTIQKPFASELLLRRIRELLDSRFAANASSPHAVSD